MKKVVAFLLALLIFVTPMTTLVKADVVIGDNNDFIVNENGLVLGRKLAMLESLSDLALSGVTEFTISNTNDVDSYLDSLWTELNSAIDSLSNGTGFETISNTLKSKYYTNIVKYKDYITNRGTYLAQLLPSGSPTTTLLSTFFANNVFGKTYTEQYDLALDMFRSLSYLTNGTPTPDVDFSAICSNISGYLYYFSGTRYNVDFGTCDYEYNIGFGNYPLYPQYPFSICWGINGNKSYFTDIGTVYLTTNQDTTVSATYIFPHKTAFLNVNGLSKNWTSNVSFQNYSGDIATKLVLKDDLTISNDNINDAAQNDFAGISTAMNYLNQKFRHINLYVDGVLWASATTSNQPLLDIDGYLKIAGNNQPTQYQLQPNTKLDYNELYEVIYNAINDNLPISQSDITYYDSHDTIYSPTIINNYGEEKGDESDLIDTILDYAVIPSFDTAIAQPMRQHLTNGVVIMQNSITNVIPDEILLILGACFFLLLFAVVINRMIK